MTKQTYYIKLEDGYVMDITKFGPKEYTQIEVDSIPSDIMSKCYKFSDGKFKLDKKKHASYKKKMEQLIEDRKMQLSKKE